MFLEGFVGKRLAARMLAEPHCLGGAVCEADHVMFPGSSKMDWSLQSLGFDGEVSPVPNMVAEFQAKHNVAFVVSERESVVTPC